MTGTEQGKPLSGRTVIVTGAASGIGLATSRQAAKAGANIVGIDLSAEGLEKAGADVAQCGGSWFGVAGSVADEAVIDAGIAAALDRFGALDCLVNNAGISGAQGEFDHASSADFDAIVAVNLKAVWYGLKAARAPMARQGRGAIVNIASMAAMKPNPYAPLYSMTKTGVVMLTKQTALSYAPDGIRVNCICPGPVETPIVSAMEKTMTVEEAAEFRRHFATTTALGRFGHPDEIASAVIFLLGDSASFITGAILPVDGGMSVK